LTSTDTTKSSGPRGACPHPARVTRAGPLVPRWPAAAPRGRAHHHARDRRRRRGARAASPRHRPRALRRPAVLNAVGGGTAAQRRRQSRVVEQAQRPPRGDRRHRAVSPQRHRAHRQDLPSTSPPTPSSSPSAFTSLERATAQPSLLESTTMGTLCRRG
jgi:hypothetical protein